VVKYTESKVYQQAILKWFNRSFQTLKYDIIIPLFDKQIIFYIEFIKLTLQFFDFLLEILLIKFLIIVYLIINCNEIISRVPCRINEMFF